VKLYDYKTTYQEKIQLNIHAFQRSLPTIILSCPGGKDVDNYEKLFVL